MELAVTADKPEPVMIITMVAALSRAIASVPDVFASSGDSRSERLRCNQPLLVRVKSALDAIAHCARRNTIVYVVVWALVPPRLEVVEVRRSEAIKRLKNVLVAVDALVTIPDERQVIDALWCLYRISHSRPQEAPFDASGGAGPRCLGGTHSVPVVDSSIR